MSDETPKRAHTRPGPPASETARARSGTRPNAQAAKSRNQSTEPEVQTDVVPGYEVLNELGRGAMGVVFRARHVKLNRVVALKMAVGTRVDPKDLIRFLAEAEAVAAVQHDNVVKVYDYGDSDGRPYMALEYCSAGTLSQLLRAEAPMDPTDAAELVGRIAEGVAAAHEQGIIHRDLKPGNVLLQVDPGALARAGLEPGEEDELPIAELTPKVADFGLAKRGAVSDLTQTNAVMGTPAYMSPEQAVGKAKFVGPQADVWALGVMLYECLTGARPFHGETAYDVLIQIQTEEPVSVRTIQTTVPHDLELIVRKCLEKNPQDRYPTGRELADDLDRFVRGEPISVRPLSTATQVKRWVKRHKAVTGLLAVVVLVTLGLMGSLYNSNRQANRNLRTERNAKKAIQEAREQEELAAAAAVDAAVANAKAAEANAEAAQAKGLVELLNNLFRSSDPLAKFFGDAAPAELGVTGGAEGKAAAYAPFLRDAAKGIMESKAEPGSEATRAKMLTALGNALKNLGLYADAKPVLTEALALRRKVRPADNPKYNPDADPEVWQSELDLGRLETEGGDLLVAIERFRRLLEFQTRAGAEPKKILSTRFYLSVALSGTGQPEGEMLRQVVDESDRLLGPHNRDTILAKIALFSWLLDNGQLDEVQKLFPKFKDDLLAIPDPQLREVFEPILDGQAYLAIAFGYRRPGTSVPIPLPFAVAGLRNAIARLEKLLPEGHLVLCIFRFETARSLMEMPDGAAEAEALFARVVTDLRKSVGVAHPSVLTLLESYSRLLADTGRADQARALFVEFEQANRERFGPDNVWRAVVLLRRARFEVRQNDPAAALKAANEALALVKRDKIQIPNRALGELFETVTVFSTAITDPSIRAATRDLFVGLRGLIAQTFGDGHPVVAVLLTIECQLAHEASDYVGAAALIDEVRRRQQNGVRLFPAEWARAFYWYGRIALDRGQFADAEQHFRDSVRQGNDPRAAEYPTKEKLATTAYLARAMAAQGKFPGAAQTLDSVRQRTLSRAPEPERAFAALELATAHLAGGNRANYQKALADLLERYGRSTDPQTLVRVAWAAALGGTPAGWDAGAFEAQFTAALGTDATDPWAWRGLALVRLRANKLVAAEAALAKAGPEQPVDHLMRGLIALARNNPGAAQVALKKAEALIEAQKPNAKYPLAYAGRVWHQHAEITILLAELKGALGKGPKG